MTHADSIWAKALEAHSDSLQSKVDLLQTKLDALQSKTEFLSNVIETANDGVSNQLASATLWLEVIAILIVIIGGGVGIYINYKKRQIEDIATIVEGKKRAVERMASETEKLDSRIRHNMSDLYKDLRKEETNALLDRLITEPYDICNLSDLLASRELGSECYPKFKEAYMKFQKEEKEMPSKDETYNLRFVILFFQHFCFLSLNDEDVAPSIRNFFLEGCCASFKRDIKRSTIGLCKAISDENSTFNKGEVLVDFLKALNKSPHKNYKELKIIFEQNITPQTLLQSAIDRCTADHVYLTLFGVTSSERDETTPHQNGES